MAGETKQAKDSKIRQLRDENGSLKARIEELLIATAPGNLATLEDSSKLKADIAVLNDSVKAKDTEIAQLQDSLTKSDAAFLEVTAELAKLNDRPVSDGMILDFINNRLDEDTWAKIGTIKKFGLATVEDSAELGEKEYHVGDKVQTPRFLSVRIAAILENNELAEDCGFIEPTHFEDENYLIQGKHIGVNRMVFALIKKNAKLKDTPQPEDELKPRIPRIPGTPDVEIKPEDVPEETAPVADVIPEESPGEKWWREFQEGLSK